MIGESESWGEEGRMRAVERKEGRGLGRGRESEGWGEEGRLRAAKLNFI